MRVTEEIESRLEKAFAPRHLVVDDVSEEHRGHAGWREGGETHFRVEIAHDGFAEMSRIARHRAVHAALGADLVARIHALELKIAV